MAVSMELQGIELERPPNIPCLVLRETEGERRILPIFIGDPEAKAIAFALEEVEVPRPMTHDLLRILLETLGATVERVVITELRDTTFFAEIVLSHAGEVHSISARPSDAVALAVRTGSPLFAEEGVLEQAARTSDEPEEIVEQFKEFIDHVNPDDFGA